MIKLQPGDYVLTKDIESEVQFWKIVEVFRRQVIDVHGVFEKLYGAYELVCADQEVIGWDERDDILYFGDCCEYYLGNVFTGRCLTPSEILEEQSPEWNGEGLPPVGTECECWHTGAFQGRVTVLYMGHEMCILYNMDGFFEQCGPIDAYDFKPIESENEETVEDIFQIIYQSAAKALYKAGYRKMENN